MNKDKQLDKAKIHLMANPNSTFITTVLFSLKFSWNNTISTAGTNGITLRINPDWWTTLTLDQQIGLLCHETYHVVFKHMERGEDKDHKKWNAAADFLINLMLNDASFELPPGGLLDEQYRDMSTLEIYNMLPDEYGENGEADVMLDIEPFEGTKEEQQALSDEVTNIIMKAATKAEMTNQAGSIPSEIKRLIDKIKNPVLPWYTILHNYMNTFAKNDYTWKRPNRRFRDLYLPSLHSEGLDKVSVAIDTSGSVSDSDFAAFLSEIIGIKELLSPRSMEIVDFDTKISNIYEVADDENIANLQFNGWGGTALEPVFEHYAKSKPDILLIFSDLECRAIEDDPGYPVIWLCHNNEHAEVNFGKLIHFTT